MSGDEYLKWHDGVEYDQATSMWRGYIESNDTGEQRFVDGTFDDRGDATVAAGKMLAEARSGTLSD
jgi:hypothetical protein